MPISLNGSSYLEIQQKLVGSFPMTMMCWVAKTADMGADILPLLQGQSTAVRAAHLFIGADGVTKYAILQHPGTSELAYPTGGPNISSTMQLMVGVFTSATSLSVYFGNSSANPMTVTGVDDLASHDRIVIGCQHYSGSAASKFLNGNIAEVHFFNAALNATQVGQLLADSVKPEAMSGWVDGWMLRSASDLTSIGGTRTLDVTGTVTTSAASHPVARAAPADTIAPVLSSPAANATSPTTATATVGTNEAGGLLYTLFSTNASEAAATIRASGQSQAVTAAGTQTVNKTGLTASTAGLKAHFVHDDSAGTPNASNVVSSATFATPAAGSVTIAAAWTEGAEVFSLAGTATATAGTLTTRIFKNNTGTPLANQAGCILNIYNATTGAFVVRLTGLTTTAAGRLIVANALLVAGTNYSYELDLTSASMGRRLPVAAAV